MQFCAKVRTLTDVFRGSKYVQSDLGDCLEQIKEQLEGNKKVMFTGTPCQVMALTRYLNKSHENLITVDLICHGVASPSLFVDYINFLSDKYGKKVSSINMKSKFNGWLHSSPQVYFVDGTFSKGNFYTKLWRRLYSSRLCMRPSCSNCPFTSMNRGSDITIGDFWGVEKKYPDFYDDNGVSLCLVNTKKGEALFNNVMPNANILQLTNKNCNQQALDHPVRKSERYDEFVNDYRTNGFDGILKKYFKFSVCKRIYNDMKIIMERRIVSKE